MSYELNDEQRGCIEEHASQINDIFENLTGEPVDEAPGDSSGSYWGYSGDYWVSTQGIALAIARAYELGLKHGREGG